MKGAVAVLMLCSAVSTFAGSADGLPKRSTFIIRGPTILAFFPPVSEEELERDSDINEVLSDFQLYATRARGPLLKMGIEFQQVYAHSFRVTSGGRTATFHPGDVKIGYYFVAPGKKPRIEYGVNTDDGIVEVAKEYFGVSSR